MLFYFLREYFISFYLTLGEKYEKLFFFLAFCLTTVFEPDLRSVLFLGGECWFSRAGLSFQGLAWVKKNLKSMDAWCGQIAPWNSPSSCPATPDTRLHFLLPQRASSFHPQIALCSVFLFIFNQFNIRHNISY